MLTLDSSKVWKTQRLMRSLVLFDQVIEILDLSQFTVFWDLSCRFQFSERFGIRGVFVHIDHTRLTCMRGSEGFHKKARGRFSISGRAQPKIERVAL